MIAYKKSLPAGGHAELWDLTFIGSNLGSNPFHRELLLGIFHCKYTWKLALEADEHQASFYIYSFAPMPRGADRSLRLT